MNSKSKLPGARCWECPLQEQACVPPSGPRNGRLVVIGEAPGYTEVERGEPFVGPSGELLDYALNKAGIDHNDVFMTNTVMCRPPGNREPTEAEVLACMPRLEEELEDTKAPVLALGKTASMAMGVQDIPRGHIWDWNGRPVMHSWHPAYLLRKPSDCKDLFKDIDRLLNGPPTIDTGWTEPVVRHITDWLGLKMVLDKVPDNTWVAFDIETDQVKWYQSFDGTPADPILMMQIAWEAYGTLQNVVIDDEMLYDVPETREILQHFFDRVYTVAHNGKFDQVFLKSHIGLNIYLTFDTMLAHYAIDENSKHGLKELTYEYFGIEDYEARLIKQYLNNRNDRYSKVPFDALAKYGVIDVYMTLQFRKLFEDILAEQGRLQWPFYNLLMRGANAFVNIELRGFKIDVEHLDLVDHILTKEMERVTREACASVGHVAINLNSSQQVAQIVYDELGLPPPKSRKLGKRSTNHEAMEPHKGKHPFVDLLSEFRRVSKMKGSYVDNIRENLDINGCVHTNVLLHGTEIGRLSSRNPALQTIPRAESAKDNKGFWGAMIKSSFVARPGKILIIVDYSQAELRVAAVLADEPFLYSVYENDRDLHTEVAVAMFGDGWTKEQRMQTKMFNFSYLYGGNEYSFAMDAGLPIEVARKFVADYNTVMPKLAEFRKNQFELLAKQGYVQSPLGRRRHFEIITKANMDDARKSAVHAPIAGTASDLTLLSGCRLEEEGFDVLLMVHDSVVLEVDESRADEVAAYAVQVMEETAREHLPQVKWKSDPEMRYRWSDQPTEAMQTLLS